MQYGRTYPAELGSNPSIHVQGRVDTADNFIRVMPARNHRDEQMERLSALMREWREHPSRRLTQAEAAELAGINPATWGYTERGDDPDRRPSVHTILGIAQTIGLGPVEALRLAGHEPSKQDMARLGVRAMQDLLERLEDLAALVRSLRDHASELVVDETDE